MYWKPLITESHNCEKLNLHLSSNICMSLHDIRKLGQGMGRGTWEIHGLGQNCHNLCNISLVRKSISNISKQSYNTVKNANIKEAILMHSLYAQYGIQKSVKMYGLCCKSTANHNKMNVIMEKLEPVSHEYIMSMEGRRQIFLYSERMVNYSRGPLKIPDFKWSSLGKNKYGHIHAIDLGCVHVGNPELSNRQLVLKKMLFCFYKRINQEICLQTI